MMRKFLMWLMASCFLIYKYIIIVFVGVISADLMSAFSINATQLGVLSAMYFYPYIVVQLFAGVLIDRFCAKRLTVFSILICSASVFLFSIAHHYVEACVCRCLMGVGASFATVSYLKLMADWYSRKYYPLLSSLLASAAMVGALFGTAGLSVMVGQAGWHAALKYISMAGFLYALLYWFIVLDKPASSSAILSFKQIMHHFFCAFRSKNNLLISLYCGLFFSPIEVFSGLWGIPFLMKGYNMTLIDASQCISYSFVGLALGAPLISLYAEFIQNRYLVMKISVVCSFVSLLMILFSPFSSYLSMAVLFFTFGFATGAFMIGFTLARDFNDIAAIATVIAVINSFEALWSALSDPLLGKLLDLSKKGDLHGLLSDFTVYAYQDSLSLLLLYLVAAFIVCLFLQRFTGECEAASTP